MGKTDNFLNEKPEKLTYSKVWEKFNDWVRAKSLWVVSYGTGCGGIEIPPMVTSRFDAERFGVNMVGTPRQADVIIISGYLSVKTLKRVIRVYEQMQSPKYVVALGSCPINGGMYYDSYNTINMLELYLPVDIWVTGCMPRPEALLSGFSDLMTRIKDGRADGWKEYTDNLKKYRKNQEKVIKNWKMPAYNW
ncbi:MAG: NADH-quinone oxidoreductase subunit NuoB [Acidobacteriota bacterium]